MRPPILSMPVYKILLVGHDNAIIYYLTTRAEKKHSDIKYPENDCFIMFGKETAGIPEGILNQNRNNCIRIPMLNSERARSLNLSNSVSIVVYEILRQHNYPNMR